MFGLHRATSSMSRPSSTASSAPLVTQQPPPPAPSQQQQQQQQQSSAASTQPAYNDGAGLRITAVLRQSNRQQGLEIQLEVRPRCEFHGAEAAATAACGTATARLAEAGRLWWLTPVGSIISITREVETLSKAAAMPLMAPLLHPDQLLGVQLGQLRNVWPPELGSRDDFNRFLRKRYDKPQLEAIELAATHMAGPDPVFACLQKQVQQQQQRRQQQQQQGQAGSSSSAANGSLPSRLPITLIQGPPGTGKTHTVIGILNTWHLTQYQRCYSSLHARLRHLSVEQLLQGLAALPNIAPKPRILVCAHSNAAVDELLERLLAGGFCDVAGAMYRPGIVRVGAEEALSERVRKVWVEELAARLLKLSPSDWQMERYNKNQRLVQLRRQVEQFKMALDEVSAGMRWTSDCH